VGFSLITNDLRANFVVQVKGVSMAVNDNSPEFREKPQGEALLESFELRR
jgi:hypothetical protein